MAPVLRGVYAFLALSAVALRPATAKELLNTPVYDPASKSYFELVDGSHGMVQGTGVDHEGPNWREALAFAKTRAYKGVAGRLALVKTLATHEFVMRTFQPETPIWIGVRYWCATQQLQDSTGATLDRTSFAPWAPNWKADVYACEVDKTTHRPAAGDYMPVAYDSMANGFRWVGYGHAKRFYHFLVEYPTGAP